MQMSAYILLVTTMRIYKITEMKKLFLYAVFTLGVSLIILIFPKNASLGAKNGIIFCAEVLVPSLFPFMFISSFTVNSGICFLLKMPFEKITRLLFNLPGSCGTTIFLSLIGGFPVGARGISSLYENKIINSEQAQQMAYFCVCSGPGFLITFVGSALYDNLQIGIILLISSVFSVIITGIIGKLFSKEKIPCIHTEEKEEINCLDFSEAMTKSAADGAKGIIEMCSMVILFNVFISFGEIIIKDEMLLKIFYIFTEVTTACNKLAGNTSAVFLAFAVGFGGLCVHFQIFQALGNIKINKAKFFFYRIIQGLFTALLAKIMLYFFPVTKDVFSNTETTTAVLSSSTYLGSVMLIITAVCFLYSLKPNRRK